MKKTLKEIQSVYETMVMGKPADMSVYYSQYTRSDLQRFRNMVKSKATALESDLLALNQQLKDIDAEINSRKGSGRGRALV